jgi:hypothetical protein
VDTYRVTISGITGSSNLTYEVKMFDARNAFNGVSAALCVAPKVGVACAATVDSTPAGVRSYQWLRAGAVIAGATGASYTPVAADSGKALSVRVSFTADGYSTASVTSAVKTVAAATSVPKPVGMGQVVLSSDLTGDGRGEVLGVDASGVLWVFPFTGEATLGSRIQVGGGFGAVKLYAPGDWDGDRKADLIGVDTAGQMWLYAGSGGGKFKSATQIGRGWSTYRVIPAGDMNGDRKQDLLAIDQGGKLWLYPGNGRGGWLARYQVGQGWGVSLSLYAAGDLNGDGVMDIFMVNGLGQLYRYYGLGGGRFGAAVLTGRGWGGVELSAGADLDGDGYSDIVGRQVVTGDLYFYANQGGGRFRGLKQIAAGW